MEARIVDEQIVFFFECPQVDFEAERLASFPNQATQMGNEKRAPSCLGYIGDDVHYPWIVINRTVIRIQPV